MIERRRLAAPYHANVRGGRAHWRAHSGAPRTPQTIMAPMTTPRHNSSTREYRHLQMGQPEVRTAQSNASLSFIRNPPRSCRLAAVCGDYIRPVLRQLRPPARRVHRLALVVGMLPRWPTDEQIFCTHVFALSSAQASRMACAM